MIVIQSGIPSIDPVSAKRMSAAYTSGCFPFAKRRMPTSFNHHGMAVGEEIRDLKRVFYGCVSIPIAMNENHWNVALNWRSEIVADIRTGPDVSRRKQLCKIAARDGLASRKFA